MKKLLISLGLSLGLVCVTTLWMGSTKDEAPDLTVQLLDGRTLGLAELRGRPVLVTFWATSCPSCVKAIPQLVKLYEELHPSGLEVIAIAMAYDPPSYVLAMVRQQQISYPVALDLNSAAASSFGNVQLIPASFLISPEGRITQRTLGEMDFERMRELIRSML